MGWVLLADIGNTSTSLALARNGVLIKAEHISGALSTDRTVGSVLNRISKGRDITGAVLSSVVPAANMVWVSLLKRRFGVYPVIVNHRLDLGIKISYPRPSSIGADRLANACGAADRHGTPVIVADFGTALTFDVICERQGYIGGVIAPGLPLMTDYLADKTALLPHIELKGACASIGRSTESAMRIGARTGYRGMVREITLHLKKGLKKKRVALCATGGYARWVLKDFDMPFELDPDLTLYGLSRIFDLNRH